MHRRLLFAALLMWPLLAAAQGGPNLLLITLDTTRADRLGCYGNKSAKTPVLDGIAARGALFEQAHAHVPLTLPSHANLLTGKLPPALNLRVNGVRLGDGVETLATHLAARGYWTGAVVGAEVLHREYGLARGFAAYDDRMQRERRADEVTKSALHLATAIKAPFFLWVHYFDPHFEYRPSYDGEITFMDANIGALLDGLRSAGLLENTLIAVAGDHGEGLMEHGERQHGVLLYESTLHVPLLMAWEGHIRAGTRIRDLCGLVDVPLTLLELLGQGTLAGADGRSLAPLLAGRALPPRFHYAESYHGAFTYGWAPLRAVMDERIKFVDAPKPELYEWRVSEEKNLYAAGREDVREARIALRGHRSPDAVEKSRAQRSLADEETRRRLASLGYLGGGAGNGDGDGLDPKDAIAIEEELRRGAEAMAAGDARRAIGIVRAVIDRNPRNTTALSMLGIAHASLGENETAKSFFETAVRLRPELDSNHLNLGALHRRMGNLDLAIREHKAALAISPRHAQAAMGLAQLLAGQGLVAEGRRAIDTTLAAGGESADLYFELGLIEVKASAWEKARWAFSKSIALDPIRVEAFIHLGRIARMQRRTGDAIHQYQRVLRLAPRGFYAKEAREALDALQR